MQYRKLGKTGITVSEVSFGSHLRKSNVQSPQQRRGQIEVGIEEGINLFDIYEHSYKQYVPMSEALSTVRDKVVISLVTVWGAADEVMDEVDYALNVFKRNHIDLFRVVLGKGWCDADQRLRALAKAREQGKVRAVGVVAHHPEHLLEGLRRYPDVVEYVMAPASFYAPLLLREDREIAPEVRKRNPGLIVMKAMAAADAEGGCILKLEPKGRPFKDLQQKDLLQLGIVSTAMPTMNSVDEVRENVQASKSGPLTQEEAKYLKLYREEGDRAFPGILPENNHWITPWKT